VPENRTHGLKGVSIESGWRQSLVPRHNLPMPQCTCLVLIPNSTGKHHSYSVVAKSSAEAARKGLDAHPFPVPDDAIITVIADGQAPADAVDSHHNARQPTFWHRAGTVRATDQPKRITPRRNIKSSKILLN